ncbi:MAG: hypothetical protein KGJ89_03365 [Patescibacteria group bacterium]|nr:hypothetical protein [Patescibacteria group bacterium]MDE2015415.1 hypothetical protein [Patescibacteria group bacterium]MDE2226970.1 hypothetical protein [Patescibacteria group bacterium]
MSKQTAKSSPRDVFMYLLATITVYFSAYSVIDLVFQYINVGFPDALNPYYDAGNAIRWPLAFLVIIFPVYVWVSSFLHKELVKNPKNGEVKIRKWLLYFTLFAAALLIIGDLVSLIYNFLGGDLTTRFLLKVLAILAVAAAVFWYYLYDLRSGKKKFSSGAKVSVKIAIVCVAVVAVTGFFIAGSPFRQRLIKFDDQKISDLQNIQWRVVNYWQQKNVLPSTIGDLRDDISGFVPPVDPQDSSAYVYTATGELSFGLCANFNEASDDKARAVIQPQPYGVSGNESWAHPAGNYCFSRTIDPQLYKPIAPAPMLK